LRPHHTTLQNLLFLVFLFSFLLDFYAFTFLFVEERENNGVGEVPKEAGEPLLLP